MGPTVKELWMPVGEEHHVLREDDLPCIGCNTGYCKIKTHDCMRRIKPERVINLILEKIGSQELGSTDFFKSPKTVS
jgi:ADP-heptose:LPS heptosyltransferase